MRTSVAKFAPRRPVERRPGFSHSTALDAEHAPGNMLHSTRATVEHAGADATRAEAEIPLD